MKKVLKGSLSVLLAVLMLSGMVPLAGLSWLTASAVSYSTGDIITYGSYPQIKITDASFRAALGELTPDSNGDVILNGIKYRRLITQNITDFYRYDPISWRVLSNGPDGLFVVADKTLDCKPYNTANVGITWADCTLRTWMNSTFYNTAFSSSEKSKIRSATLINDANPTYGTPGGIETTDKVFILSYYDAITSQYGFSTSGDESTTRNSQPTDYSKALGVTVGYFGGGACWWLRTPGDSSSSACNVNPFGRTYNLYGNSLYYYSVNYTNVGICPAIKIDLTSGIFPSKSYNSYIVKAVDATTGKPLNGASVVFDGNTVGTTAADGAYTLAVGCSTDSSKQVTISKSGYSSETRRLYELNAYGQNTIGMTIGADFSQIFANAAFAKEKICGPTVNILGNSFPLFSFDANLDFGGFSFKSKQDTVNKTVKYIIGIDGGVSVASDDDFNSNYADFKNFFKGFSEGTQEANYFRYNKIKDKLKQVGGSVGFNANLSVAGYMEFDYSTGSLVFKEGGMVVTAQAAVSQDVPFWGVFYATFTIGGEIDGQLYTTNDGSGVLGLNANLSLAVQPSIGVGIGNSNIACIEAGIDGEIKGSVKLPASSLSESLTLTLSAQAYIKAKLLFLENKWETNFPNLELYPNFGQLNAKSMGIEADGFVMIPRDYLNKQVKSYSSGIGGTNIYPYGAPKLTRLNNGNTVAMWIYDDGTKSDANRTTLFYSVYNGTQWSSPAAVYESGKADFNPVICSDGTKIYAVWQRGTQVFDDNMTLADALAKTQLVYACFDGSAWSQPVNVGNFASGKYPVMYSIASNTTNVAIAWVENSLNDYSFATGTTSIYKQQMASGTWGAVTQAAAPSNVGSLALGYVSGNLSLAYTTDMDGNPATSGDSELYMNGTRATTNTVDDTGVTYQNGSFYYISGGMLANYSTGITNLSVSGDYQFVGNGAVTAVVFPATDGFKNELNISYLSNGVYSTPVTLTSYGRHISAYSAVMDSNNAVLAAMDIDNLSNDTGVYPYTTTDFVVNSFGQAPDLGIDSLITYDSATVTPGGTAAFTATVTNSGTAAATGYTVNIKNAAGTVLAARMFQDTIAVGTSKSVTVNYTIPTGFAKQSLTFEVVAAGDSNTGNNTAAITVGYADIAVISCAINNGVISATVVNNGCDTAANINVTVSKFTDNSVTLTTIPLGNIAAGQTQNITYTVPAGYLTFSSAYVSNKFTVTAATDSTELNLSNNAAEVLVSPVPAQSISMSTSTLNMEIGSTASLVATVYPSNAYNKTVHWVSDSTNIVSVDSNGNLTAAGAGTAIITAMSDDGGFVAQCAVTVSISVRGVSMTPGSATVNVGNTIAMNYVINPAGATNPAVTWTSSVPAVASVNSAGIVTAYKSGVTTVTVTTVNGSYTASCVVTVINAVKGLSISDSVLSLYTGKTKQLYATVTPANADNQSVIWSSSDDDIVSVDGIGLITASNTGTATITVRSVDGNYTAQCVVTVGKHVTAVYLSSSAVNLVPGLTQQLTVTVMPLKSLNKNVDWVSTNENVATVSAGGLITATGTGTATVIVETADGGFTAACTVTVTNSAAGYTLNSHAQYITINGTVQMAGTFTPLTAVNKNVSWVSSDSSIVSVSGTGLVTGLKAGSAVIIATTQDGGYKDYCIVRVVGIVPKSNTKTVIDAKNGFIYGLSAGINSVNDYVTLADSTCSLGYTQTDNGFGTQTIVNLTRNGDIVDSYTVVLFGDVNGDGNIDSIDAGIIVDYQNYMVTWNPLTDAAKIKAADLNGDGNIDSIDAGIAVDSQNYMVTIDQSTGRVVTS